MKTGAEIMEEEKKAEKADACENAVMAAMEVLSESCGGKVVRIPGIGMVQVPKEIHETLQGHFTMEEKIEIVSKTKWALDWARGMLQFTGAEPTQENIDRLARRAAEAIVE